MRDSDPLPRPYAADLPVVLLGDAAHAFLPTIGMGASLAIEDAEALGALVGRHLRGGTGSLRDDVLTPFGRIRYPVWHDLMGRARAAVVNWRHDGPDQGFVLSPYVPTRIGSAVVRAYERFRGRERVAT
jgi:2-polyprenyl-6-methoxyphenol hydroxylase-like FAD-dependent oxidoreductase